MTGRDSLPISVLLPACRSQYTACTIFVLGMWYKLNKTTNNCSSQSSLPCCDVEGAILFLSSIKPENIDLRVATRQA